MTPAQAQKILFNLIVTDNDVEAGIYSQEEQHEINEALTMGMDAIQYLTEPTFYTPPPMRLFGHVMGYEKDGVIIEAGTGKEFTQVRTEYVENGKVITDIQTIPL